MQQYWRNLLKDESDQPGELSTEINAVKAKLQNFQDKRYRGAVVRARAEKFLLGEQPTKRALADERKFALAKEITSVDQNGVVSSDKDDIKKVFVAYYVELFGGKDRPKDMTAINDLLRTAPELSQEAKEWMEEPITLSEIDRAIEGMAAHKTPGPDGLCAEFYQHFRAQLCPFYLED
ncbi:hypothetical protein HPB47_017702, partial [Ixodes persulcatus]